jgi:hypothetical protein
MFTSLEFLNSAPEKELQEIFVKCFAKVAVKQATKRVIKHRPYKTLIEITEKEALECRPLLNLINVLEKKLIAEANIYEELASR